jgi:hypothetical protein
MAPIVPWDGVPKKKLTDADDEALPSLAAPRASGGDPVVPVLLGDSRDEIFELIGRMPQRSDDQPPAIDREIDDRARLHTGVAGE